MIPQLLVYSPGPAVHGFGLMGFRALCSGCGARGVYRFSVEAVQDSGFSRNGLQEPLKVPGSGFQWSLRGHKLACSGLTAYLGLPGGARLSNHDWAVHNLRRSTLSLRS